MVNLVSKREHEMDVLKGIGIFLVVLGHVNATDNPLTDWVYSFHMPMFFMIAGLYVAQSWDRAGSLKKFVAGKLRSLIYPYIAFSALAIVWQLVLYALLRGSYLGSFSEALNKTAVFFGYGALWFLPALFLGELMYGLWRRFKLKWYAVFPVLILTVLGQRYLAGENFFAAYKYYPVNFYLFTVVFRGVICFLFVYAGSILRKLLGAARDGGVLRKALFVFISAILFLVNLRIFARNGLVNLSMGRLNDQLLYYACALSGGVSMIVFFHCLARACPLLEYFGRNSLIIFATHSPFHIWNFALFLYKCIPGLPGGYYSVFPEAILVMLLEIPLIELINRFAPWLVSPYRAQPRRLYPVRQRPLHQKRDCPRQLEAPE